MKNQLQQMPDITKLTKGAVKLNKNMPKLYNVIVIKDDFTGVEFEEVMHEEKIKERLENIVPECGIDWGKVFADKRCTYFRHYMPANVTTNQYSHKRNAELHKNGNDVKVYIYERWHERT